MLKINEYNYVVKLLFSFAFFTLSVVEDSRADFNTSLSAVTGIRPDNSFEYTYKLENLSSSTENAYLLSITVDTSANLTGITGPAGWDVIYNNSDSTVIWQSSDPSFDLLPGTDASFTFFSGLGPISKPYFVAGTDEFTQIDFNNGKIDSPGVKSVPEPTSMIPLGIGVATVVSYTRYRRRSSSDDE